MKGHGGLFSKAAYAYLVSWNGSEDSNLCMGQPLKGIFVVALAFTACYGPDICGSGGVRLFRQRRASSEEFVMRLLKRDPHSPIIGN